MQLTNDQLRSCALWAVMKAGGEWPKGTGMSRLPTTPHLYNLLVSFKLSPLYYGPLTYLHTQGIVLRYQGNREEAEISVPGHW